MRKIPYVLTAFCLTVVAPHAQEPGRTEAPPQVAAHNTMVLTGCLAAGAGTSAFTLNNAVPNEQASAVQPNAVATSGQRATYELKAETRLDTQTVPAVDLKNFVGQQVQVTARPDETVTAQAVAKPSGSPATEPAAPQKADEKVDRLIVTAIKQLSASCR